MYQRQEFQVLKSRLEEPRRFIQVIAGPRQVGKSTMVKQVLESLECPHLSCTTEDAPDTNAQWIRNRWEEARQTMRFRQYNEFLLVIDEVHKLDNWSNAVKAEWDYDTRLNINIKVVILGSSRLLLKDGLTESLAGRFELIEMEHWSYTEMHDAFGMTIDKYIYFGGYPGGEAFVEDEVRWKNYIRDSIIEPAITKDVLMTKRIYKPALLKQMFQMGCAYSGQLLAFNKMLGQLQDAGNTETLAGYLQVLDESRLLGGLQRYAQDEARKYKSVPKYQVYNSALLSATANKSFEDTYTSPEEWGRWVETAVGVHLISNAKRGGYKVFYWRENNDEIDFVLQKSNRLVALEVKSGRRKKNSGLVAFGNKYVSSLRLVIGGETFPIEQFLQTNPSRLFEI